jgi:hypothetical protein
VGTTRQSWSENIEIVSSFGFQISGSRLRACRPE